MFEIPLFAATHERTRPCYCLSALPLSIVHKVV